MATIKFNPFLFYSKQLEALLAKAAEQKNPALWLHKNDARTPLFMLEALTRLHSKAFDEKLFDRWNIRFKKLEDLFGEIEQYLTLENELKLNKKVSKEVLKYFSVTANNFVVKCNQRLREKNWFNNKLKSFDYKLSEFDVEYNQEYLDELKYTMADEIEAIINFAKKSNYHFTKVEEEVHELRRKLRWLSIYAHALNGLIQLKKSNKKTKFKLNYYTKEILNSPFNKLPLRPKNTAVITFDEDAFLALSWMINELGVLKDNALKIQKLGDAIYIVEDVTIVEANKKAIAVLGLKVNSLDDILNQASIILETFLAKDKVLNSLVIG
jgi:hypothetical protein